MSPGQGGSRQITLLKQIRVINRTRYKTVPKDNCVHWVEIVWVFFFQKVSEMIKMQFCLNAEVVK